MFLIRAGVAHRNEFYHSLGWAMRPILLTPGDPRRGDRYGRRRGILHAIEQAQRIEQVAKLPGWRLHPLKGDRRGEWSVWVSGNFRLTFRVDAENVNDIDLEDYH